MSVDYVCEICSVEEAKYRCKYCGKNVCKDHIDLKMWICLECKSNLRYRQEQLKAEIGRIYRYGLLIIVSVVLMAIGFTILMININQFTMSLEAMLPFIEGYRNLVGIAISLIFFVFAFILLFYFLKYVFKATTF